MIDFLRVPTGCFSVGLDKSDLSNEVDFWLPFCKRNGFTSNDLFLWFSKECPTYQINLDEFYMSKYPLTNFQVSEMVGATKMQGIEARAKDNKPYQVSSIDVVNIILKGFSLLYGKKFRLPSELEWECAASGLEKYKYPYGNNFDPKKSNCYQSGLGELTDVTLFEEFSSPFGFVDMAGNSEEWTSSNYKPYPNGNYVSDFLENYNKGDYKVMKGGNYILDGDLTRNSRRHGPVGLKEFEPKCMRIVRV